MADAPVIVEAVAVAAGRGVGDNKSSFSAELERVMSAVVLKCYDEGLAGDPAAIRERMMQAREDFKRRMG